MEEEQFKSLISTNSFLEYANFSGNWYGTSWAAIQKVKDQGKICILDVDLAGVKSIKAHVAEKGGEIKDTPQYIFVRPPGKDHLEARLKGRGTESEESLSRRLARVDADFEYAKHAGNYDLVLINDEFDSAYLQLVSFIFNIKPEECETEQQQK